MFTTRNSNRGHVPPTSHLASGHFDPNEILSSGQSSSIKAFSVFLQNWDKDKIDITKETKALLVCNDKLEIVDIDSGSEKNITEESNTVDPNEIFTLAKNVNAEEIILAQNSSFNNLDNTGSTDKLLEKFKKASQDFGIKVNDFLILSRYGYFSYNDNRML